MLTVFLLTVGTLTLQRPDAAVLITKSDTVIPAVKIAGPVGGKVKAGKLVKLSVQLPPPQANLYSAKYAWIVPNADDLDVDRLDGTIAKFGSGTEATTFNVSVIATYTFVDWTNKTVNTVQQTDSTTVQVVLVGKDPVPVPDPTPAIPKITLPDGQFKVSQTVFNIFDNSGFVDKANVAHDLAKNYRQVSADIISRNSKNLPITAEYILTTLSTLNRATVVSNPSYLTLLGTVADKVDPTRKSLKDLLDWSVFLNELAVGLEAVQ